MMTWRTRALLITAVALASCSGASTEQSRAQVPAPTRKAADLPADGDWDRAAASDTETQASEYVDWVTPSDYQGYRQIYQTFLVRDEAPSAALFPASQWGTGAGGFYFGIQMAGELGKTALFSFFGNGATTTSPNCKAGADGDAGMSCHVRYDWQPGRPYTFFIDRESRGGASVTWRAWLNDDLAGWAPTAIGNFTIPDDNGLAFPAGGFVEAFRTPGPSCADLWKIDIVIGNPVAVRPDGSVDRFGLADAYTNGCPGTFKWNYYRNGAVQGIELLQGSKPGS
jgi:hypothetical protein